MERYTSGRLRDSGPVHTCPDIFENASFFRFGLASTRRRRFRSPETKLFENALQSGSFWVKTELFENADVTASISVVSEHAHGSSGITQGHFDCLFSFVKVRTAEFECSSVFVWTGISSKMLLVWTQIFFIRIKKMRFQKYPDTCGRGLTQQTFLNRGFHVDNRERKNSPVDCFCKISYKIFKSLH